MTSVATWFQRHLASYAHPAVRRMLFLGFASGLPFPLVLMTLSARLQQAGINRATIGTFSLVGLAYSLKFFWSPVVDRLRLPLLGRALGQRRSWMLLAQTGVLAGIVLLALHHPAQAPLRFALLATFTAFCGATQDIVIDAYRIESADASWQGATAASYQVGYQLALICGGAGALIAASGYGWMVAYLIMAGCMLVAPVTCLIVPEPVALRERAVKVDPALIAKTIARMHAPSLVAALGATAAAWAVLHFALPAGSSATVIDASFGAIALFELVLLAVLKVRLLRPALERLTGSVVLPLTDFLGRFGPKLAVPMLLLIVTYRLNYMTMGMAANTFYLDMHYTLDQIAVVSKVYGVVLTLTGALLAGWMVKRAGALQTMLLGLVLLTAANLFYAHLAGMAGRPPPLHWLAGGISLDNVANGIAGTAFIAWMSSLTSKDYTATQYALFGTLWSLPAKTIASQWGRVVDVVGYPTFYVYTALVGLPALLLILWLLRRPGTRVADQAGGAA
ncbi:MAG TPA: MFS transporter [Rhodanobacteraceae bacterium]|nr:MFS transporter [Rhodanobacteraceae bacterium]